MVRCLLIACVFCVTVMYVSAGKFNTIEEIENHMIEMASKYDMKKAHILNSDGSEEAKQLAITALDDKYTRNRNILTEKLNRKRARERKKGGGTKSINILIRKH